MDTTERDNLLVLGDLLIGALMAANSVGVVDGVDFASDFRANVEPTAYQSVDRALRPVLLLLAGGDEDRAADLRRGASDAVSVTSAVRHYEREWLIADAVEHGKGTGWAHENFVQAYGQQWDKPLEVPARFAAVADYWTGAVGDGRQGYRDERED